MYQIALYPYYKWIMCSYNRAMVAMTLVHLCNVTTPTHLYNATTLMHLCNTAITVNMTALYAAPKEIVDVHLSTRYSQAINVLLSSNARIWSKSEWPPTGSKSV